MGTILPSLLHESKWKISRSAQVHLSSVTCQASKRLGRHASEDRQCTTRIILSGVCSALTSLSSGLDILVRQQQQLYQARDRPSQNPDGDLQLASTPLTLDPPSYRHTPRPVPTARHSRYPVLSFQQPSLPNIFIPWAARPGAILTRGRDRVRHAWLSRAGFACRFGQSWRPPGLDGRAAASLPAVGRARRRSGAAIPWLVEFRRACCSILTTAFRQWCTSLSTLWHAARALYPN